MVIRKPQMSLVQHFNDYSAWRTGLGRSVSRLRDWLTDGDLNDAQSDSRLQHLLERLRDDKLVIAFVAEFSRGKSELINAIFFSEYGSRILPSSAGRTTMCPTELAYEPARAAAIELLPIETRSRQSSIAEYKNYPDEWRRFDLDTSSSEAMAEALRRVGDHKRVSAEVARDLGFAIDDKGEDGLRPDAEGQVDIPCWRHAMINFPHPLLEQGLVILDTPGLNAIGAEPELTLSLLPNAHAILFILAADTGVTLSDMTVWRDHVGAGRGREKGRIVVLNKIDGLWDGLRAEAEIDLEIAQQVQTCARTLEMSPEHIFPVSAQKGLVAKINHDAGLLARSRLPQLEDALTRELLPAKQEIVGDSIAAEAIEILATVRAVLHTRLSGLVDQLDEFIELRGKNQHVIEYMMRKVKSEKDEFERGLQQYYAVRSVFSQLTNNLLAHLGMEVLREEIRRTREEMRGAIFSRKLTDAMSGFFLAAKTSFEKSAKEINEISRMMTAMYKRFSVEHGLKLDNVPAFSLLRHEKELARLEQTYQLQFKSLFSILTREKKVLTQQFFETLTVQVRKTFQEANQDVEYWLRALMAPVETQVREIQLQLKRRLESVKRIHQATDTLEDRIGELRLMQSALLAQLAELSEVEASLASARARAPETLRAAA
jgi:hypothetical protein